MTTADVIAAEEAFQVPTYAKMPLALTRGEGVYVWDADGNRYLDFYGGHCVLPLGHCPPRVVAALKQQAETLMFYSNVVYSPVRARAAELLARLAPPGLGHAFFCNSGTEANETALKLARTHTGRKTIIATEESFHGRTLGSLAVTGEAKYRKPYEDILPKTIFVPFGDLEAAEAVLAVRNDVAAVILEPIQSMAGVTEAPDAYYRGLRAACDRNGALLIFDEVQTGVGRSGTFSIAEQYGVVPDLITLAKSLASGVPVGAVLVRNEISARMKNGDQGTTFGGGMLAMAALTATLETILEENLMARATHIFDRLRRSLEPYVKEVRGRGCLIGLELHAPAKEVINGLRQAGVITGGASNPNVIRLMPPLNTSDDALQLFIDIFERVLAAQPAHA